MHAITERPTATLLDEDVVRMFTSWLGTWPAAGMFRVAPSARRLTSGWDGRPQPLVGVAAGPGLHRAVVLSVTPQRFRSVGALVNELAARGELADRTQLGTRLPEAVGMPERRYTEAVLRWTLAPVTLPYVGLWGPSDEPGLPAWLQPFRTNVLVARDRRGRFLGGAGIKRHSALAHEIAVGTAVDARGRGLARSLVAQAAARVLADGAIPLYLHDDHNIASAHVADAAGLPDRGWRWLGLSDPDRIEKKHP